MKKKQYVQPRIECFYMQTEMPLAVSPFVKPENKQPDLVVDPTQTIGSGNVMSNERGYAEVDADYYDY